MVFCLAEANCRPTTIILFRWKVLIVVLNELLSFAEFFAKEERSGANS